MVASRQVKIPFYRGIRRQRERGCGAVAQGIGRTEIPFLRKHIMPAAKRMSADLLEIAAPEIAEVVSDRKNFKTAAKSVGRQTLRKQLGSVIRKRSASSHFNKICRTNQAVAKRNFWIHFSLIKLSSFRYHTFIAVFGNLGGKVPLVDAVL